jgi:hypothetical protein
MHPHALENLSSLVNAAPMLTKKQTYANLKSTVPPAHNDHTVGTRAQCRAHSQRASHAMMAWLWMGPIRYVLHQVRLPFASIGTETLCHVCQSACSQQGHTESMRTKTPLENFQTMLNAEEQAVTDQSAEGPLESTEDRSNCGTKGTIPCSSKPYCDKGLLPTEEGICKVCGNVAGSIPCADEPKCAPRLLNAINGVELETCEPCGNLDQPPCGDRLKDKPCDDGLFRTTMSLEDGIRIRAVGQESFCSGVQVAGQCGFVGQESCEGECKGRSTASEDGQICEECGGEGMGTCDQANTQTCDKGLNVQKEADLAPVCICTAGTGMCDPAASVVTQSGGDNNCGNAGKAVCVSEPFCKPRLIPGEDGLCATLKTFIARSLHADLTCAVYGYASISRMA